MKYINRRSMSRKLRLKPRGEVHKPSGKISQHSLLSKRGFIEAYVRCINRRMNKVMAASFELRNVGKKSIAKCLRGNRGLDIYEVAGVEVANERREQQEQTVHIQTTIQRDQ